MSSLYIVISQPTTNGVLCFHWCSCYYYFLLCFDLLYIVFCACISSFLCFFLVHAFCNLLYPFLLSGKTPGKFIWTDLIDNMRWEKNRKDNSSKLQQQLHNLENGNNEINCFHILQKINKQMPWCAIFGFQTMSQKSPYHKILLLLLFFIKIGDFLRSF